MRSLLTPRMEIDPAAVAELAIEQYRRSRAFWRKQPAESRPDDLTLQRQWRAWAQKTAEAAQQLAVERDRRARLTEAERQREDLAAYRARIASPLTCPDRLFRALDDEPAAHELAKIDAQISSIDCRRAS